MAGPSTLSSRATSWLNQEMNIQQGTSPLCEGKGNLVRERKVGTCNVTSEQAHKDGKGSRREREESQQTRERGI